MRRVDLSVVGAFLFAFLLLGKTLVAVVAGRVVVGTPLLASSSGSTIHILVLEAKPLIVAVFLAAMALNVAEISCPHRHPALSNSGPVVVAPGEVVHLLHVLHGGLHLLQPERPVAVVGVPDVAIVVGETLENDVLQPLD